MQRFFILFVLFLGSLLYAQPIVSVSIQPQKYFVEQIARDLVTVNVMVPAGASPHTYEPKPSQMKALSSSDAYFKIDDGFEKAWFEKFKNLNAKMVIVNTAEGIQKLAMTEHHHDAKADEHDDDGGLDPHIWLDPILVKTQATHIYDTLVKLYPEHRAVFTQNYDTFMISLDALDVRLRQMLAGVQHRKFIVFHPSFGYFANRYAFEQIPVEVSGKEPKPAELATIITEAQKENAHVVFVSPQFSKKSAETIAKQINGKILTIDPLAYAWQENLLAIAQIFQSELK